MNLEEAMSEINFENLKEILIKTLPELRSQYESELRWWNEEQPGSHIIFGDILTPYIISLLESGTGEETLKRIFALLETLANHKDPRVQEVVSVSVCERLGDKKEWLVKARKYMGPTTLRLSHEIEDFWGREKL